jgi:PAS domain S-box-containing protein
VEMSAATRGDLRGALARVGFPIFIVDTTGRHVWLNDAAVELVGNRVGQYFGGTIVPEYRRRAQEEIVRRLHGETKPAEFRVKLRTRDGRLTDADVSAVPLRDDDHIVGIFDIAHAAPYVESKPRPNVHLTPRQTEVLRELARGCSTEEIARLLGISPETVRNHVRGILRGLGVHSRLEAVLRASELGLV